MHNNYFFFFFLTKQSRATTLIVKTFIKEAITESHFHSSQWQELILEYTLRHSLTICKATERRVPFRVDFVHNSFAAQNGFVLVPVRLVWYLVNFLLVALFMGAVFLSVAPQMFHWVPSDMWMILQRSVEGHNYSRVPTIAMLQIIGNISKELYSLFQPPMFYSFW